MQVDAEITSESGPSTASGDMTLLIVDDDRAFVQRLGRAMEARGYTVTVAESVREGLEVVERANLEALNGHLSAQETLVQLIGGVSKADRQTILGWKH